MLKHRFYGVVLSAAAAVSWGTIGLAQSCIQSEMNAFWVVLFRLFFAAVFFLVCFLIFHKVQHSVLRRQSYKTWGLVTFASVLLVINNVCFIFGVRNTGLALGSATTIGSATLWAGLLTMMLVRALPSRGWWIGAFTATFGVLAMATSQAFLWHIEFQGLAACIVAGFCYAGFTLISEKLVQTLPVLTVTTVVFVEAFLLSLISTSVLFSLPEIYFEDWWVLIYLGFVPTGLAFIFYTASLEFISTKTAVAMTLLDPVTSFILAVSFAGEPFGVGVVLGLILILFGLRLVMWADQKQS